MSANRTTLSSETRLTLLEDDMEKLIGNGKQGVIQDLREDMSDLKDLVLKVRWAFWGGFSALMVMLALSGSGTVSLKSLINLLGK
jgi:hypothetical protein